MEKPNNLFAQPGYRSQDPTLNSRAYRQWPTGQFGGVNAIYWIINLSFCLGIVLW